MGSNSIQQTELSKIRHFVNFITLKSVYHAIIESHLNLSLAVWAKNASSIERVLVLKKKSLRILNFLKRNAHKSNLFQKLDVLIKFPDKVTPYFNQSLPKT